MATLTLMVGAPGSGKSTFLNEQVNDGQIVSRDAIRFDLLEDDEPYFSREEEVFDAFIDFIQAYLDRDVNVYADATHMSEKARNKVLNKLTLGNHKLNAIVFNYPIEVCLERNAKRTGRALVPEKAIWGMWRSYSDPANDKKYKYDKIVYMKGGDAI